MEIPESCINNIHRFITARRYSRINTSNPNPIIYPKYYQAKRFEIVLNEGDSIYIPYGWYHHVFSETINSNSHLNISINFWSYNYNKNDINILLSDYSYNNIDYISNVDTKIYKNYNGTNYPFITKISIPDYNDLYNLLSSNVTCVNTCSNNMFIPNHFGNLTDVENISFKEFINKKNTSNCYYYIQNRIIDKNIQSKTIQSIIPKYFDKPIDMIYIWANFGKISSIMHYDEYDNILCQLQGSKRIFLFPPSERDNLYLYNPFNFELLYSIEKLHKLSINKVVDINDVYVQYFKKTLPSHICDHIIQLLKDKHIYETRLLDIDAKMDSIFFDILNQTLELYNKTLINHKNIFPYTSFNDTGYIIRCYNFNKQLNPLHFSGFNNVPKNAFLKYIWFLNDHPIPTYINNHTYEALAGSLLIYPVHFTYLECEDPIVQNKYICYGYLCTI